MLSKLNWIGVIILIIIILQMCYLPITQEIKRGDKVKNFVSQAMNGHITSLQQGGRGTYDIIIQNKNHSSKLKYTLINGWFLKENTIKMGDSISKVKNDTIMVFYKLDVKGYKKCCEYNMSSLFL